MNKVYTLVFMIIFCGTVSAQSIGFDAGIFDVAHHTGLGFCAGAEYSHSVASKLEVMISTAYIRTAENYETGQLEYRHIPVFIGGRYYFAKGKFKPYFTITAGMSFVKNSYLVDVLNDPNDILKGTHKILNSFEGVYFGYSSSLGIMMKLSDSIDLNFGTHLIFITQKYADFISLTGGFVFRL